MSKVDPAQYALLGRGDVEAEEPAALVVKRAPPVPRRPVATTILYCMVMVINGGLVGAFGPSLEPFSRSTGASMGVLGGSIMQNRLAKLAGTVLWGFYANRVQQLRPGEHCALPPHTLMAASLLLLAACCAVFGFTRSGAVLQLVMMTSGFMYGVSDSAANLMITWVWQVGRQAFEPATDPPPAARARTHIRAARRASLAASLIFGACVPRRSQHDARKQRVNVAVLNAMFTVGAFVTPMLIATSMHHMHGAVWPAYYVLAIAAILEACLLPQLPSPDPIRHPEPASVAPVEESGFEMAMASPMDSESASDAEDATRPLTPKTSSTPGAKLDGSGGWVYVGDPEAEAVLPRYVVVMLAICTLCFFANGCEHATATWLSSFGIQQRHLGEETMAIMTSNFWTAMSMGRVAWACFAGYVTSAWPALFANTLCCIVSALAMSVPSHALLWSSAMGLGLGVASSFPAAVTLPAEMSITMTPCAHCHRSWPTALRPLRQRSPPVHCPVAARVPDG